jgi:hypothetical protein
MSADVTCDGCGRQAPMVAGVWGWEKPPGWLQRVDLAKGVQDACSRDCAAVIDRRAAITQL